MKNRKMRDLLDKHARSLIKGVNEDESLLARYPDDAEELRSLFQLASALKAALVPVKTPEPFKPELKQQLASITPSEITINDSSLKQRRWIVVAAAGSALSVLGIVLYIVRRIRAASQTAQPATTVA